MAQYRGGDGGMDDWGDRSRWSGASGLGDQGSVSGSGTGDRPFEPAIRGWKILEAGERWAPCDALPDADVYRLDQGWLKRVSQDAGGAEQIDGFVGPGDVIWGKEPGCLSREDALVAVQPTWITRFDLSALDMALKRRLKERETARLREEYLFRLRLSIWSPKRQVAAFLCFLSERLSSRAFRLPMNQKDAAAYLGMPAAKLQRCIKYLMWRGFVDRDGALVVLSDPAGLSDWLQDVSVDSFAAELVDA